MKPFIRKSFVLPVLIALELVLVSQLPAQTFKTLHNFNSSDGGHSYGGLFFSSNTLYGTTESTVFALNSDGTGFRTLHSFTNLTEGVGVYGGLVLSGNTLYGTTSQGGGIGLYGTVFAVNTDGTGFTSLFGFSNSEGNGPSCDLLLDGSTLYGVTPAGGDLGGKHYGNGTVFAINTGGSGFINLYNFSGWNDGDGPYAGLVLSNNTLFGTTLEGGTFGTGGVSALYGNGTVFAINTDGTGLTTLYSFTAPNTNSLGVYTNSDGFYPRAGLVLSGGSIYGATSKGGIFGSGTIFRLQADGSGFTSLYNFPELPSSGPYTNSGGASPRAVLSISGQTLYGTTPNGGIFGNGTVFAINTDGTGFTILHSFKGGVDGATPGRLLLSGNTLYGTTAGNQGTTSSYGTVFSISLPSSQPQLTIASSGQNVLLSWPTNSTGFTLQCTTNLGSPVWTTNLPAPVVVNGQYTVTNPISGTQEFFRLSY
jgi:uncharacterized repeat protein (TIGR03803 family)